MALSFPLTPPTARGPRSIAIEAFSTVGTTVSPFTGEQQHYVHQGEFWGLQFALGDMNRAEGEEWAAFLTALNGREGTFLMGDPLGASPRGVATGTPLVNGAAQIGKTLATDGWTINITGILKAGDWLQLGSGATTRLHKVVQDANSDALGQATLEIWPRLRGSPADNAPIVIANTRGIWRLKENRRQYSMEDVRILGIALGCIEAL